MRQSQPALLPHDPGQEHPQPILRPQLLPKPQGEERQLFQIRSHLRLANELVPFQCQSVQRGLLSLTRPKGQNRYKKNLPWKQPPVVVPPRPNRPVPPNPANLKPVKPPPPGIERARPAGPPSRDLPPLDPEGQQQQQQHQEQSSGSGLAPHVRGRPLPEPNPDRPEGSLVLYRDITNTNPI